MDICKAEESEMGANISSAVCANMINLDINVANVNVEFMLIVHMFGGFVASFVSGVLHQINW